MQKNGKKSKCNTLIKMEYKEKCKYHLSDNHKILDDKNSC